MFCQGSAKVFKRAVKMRLPSNGNGRYDDIADDGSSFHWNVSEAVDLLLPAKFRLFALVFVVIVVVVLVSIGVALGLFKCLLLHGMPRDGEYTLLKLEEWFLQLRNQLRNVDRGFVVLLLFFVIRAKNQKIASLPGSNDLLEVGNPLIPRHVGSTPWNERFAVFLGLQQ